MNDGSKNYNSININANANNKVMKVWYNLAAEQHVHRILQISLCISLIFINSPEAYRMKATSKSIYIYYI